MVIYTAECPSAKAEVHSLRGGDYHVLVTSEFETFARAHGTLSAAIFDAERCIANIRRDADDRREDSFTWMFAGLGLGAIVAVIVWGVLS